MNKLLKKILHQGQITHPDKDINDYELDEEASDFSGLDWTLVFKKKEDGK